MSLIAPLGGSLLGILGPASIDVGAGDVEIFTFYVLTEFDAIFYV